MSYFLFPDDDVVEIWEIAGCNGKGMGEFDSAGDIETAADATEDVDVELPSLVNCEDVHPRLSVPKVMLLSVSWFEILSFKNIRFSKYLHLGSTWAATPDLVIRTRLSLHLLKIFF